MAHVADHPDDQAHAGAWDLFRASGYFTLLAGFPGVAGLGAGFAAGGMRGAVATAAWWTLCGTAAFIVLALFDRAMRARAGVTSDMPWASSLLAEVDLPVPVERSRSRVQAAVAGVEGIDDVVTSEGGRGGRARWRRGLFRVRASPMSWHLQASGGGSLLTLRVAPVVGLDVFDGGRHAALLRATLGALPEGQVRSLHIVQPSRRDWWGFGGGVALVVLAGIVAVAGFWTDRVALVELASLLPFAAVATLLGLPRAHTSTL